MDEQVPSHGAEPDEPGSDKGSIDLSGLLQMSSDALDTDNEQINPSFDLNSSTEY